MSKFAGAKAPTYTSNLTKGGTLPKGPTKTKKARKTAEGGAGFAEGAKTELFLAATTTFYGEDQFYRSGNAQAARFRELVLKVTKKDEEWMQNFVRWLRRDANIRTAAIVAAAEYIRAGGSGGRAVVKSVCARADEPAEMLAYWTHTYGRKLPAALKRGLADASQALYNERSFLKWDSSARSVRMADVIEMTHPTPRDAAQSALFRHAIEARQGRDLPHSDTLADLPTLSGVYSWRESAKAGKVDFDLPEGVTWEALSSYTKMDAKAWTSAIPKMGYMALIRNLRNFDQAGISEKTIDEVNARIADPDEVRNSRQLPFRFYSAYTNADRATWGRSLSKALDVAMDNVPEFPGRTLIAVDTSGSMVSPMANMSSVHCVAGAALFGSAVAHRSEDATLIAYASTWRKVDTKGSVLTKMDTIRRTNVGYGTETWPSVADAFRKYGPFDRVLVFTDMQDHPNRSYGVPADVPVFVWDLRGYGTSNIEAGTNRYLLGGLSDQSFKTIRQLEDYRPGVWPWEAD